MDFNSETLLLATVALRILSKNRNISVHFPCN